jgi:protein-S-isoprenylcysteine O-methyltransferase Ste14
VAPLPNTHASAQIAFDVLLTIFAVCELRVRLRSAINRQGTRADHGSLAAVFVSIGVGLMGGFLFASDVHGAAISFARWALFVLGLVLMAAGIAVRQWAVALLGPFFTTDVRVHAGQTVVESGPYRWVRHPAYTGLIVSFCGIGLALGNWASLAALALLPTLGLIIRIRVEERALVAGLGEPYRRFAATRARLIPRVW